MRRISFLSFGLAFALALAGCATPDAERHGHGETAPAKGSSKDDLHPLTEINLDRVIGENRGLRVLEENARTVHDYYRGGVQEKAEGERLFREGKWKDASEHFEKSNRFLQIVLDYFPSDEPYRNLYGDHTVIFLPNLLIADNYLKLARIYRQRKMEDEIYWASREGKKFLSFSLRSVKTEWGLQVKKEFEEILQKR